MSQWSNRYQILETLDDCNLDVDSNSDSASISSCVPISGSATISDSSFVLPPNALIIRTAESTPLSTKVHLSLSTLDNSTSLSPTSLLDCGAMGLFIDSKFVKKHNLSTTKLYQPIPVYNVDGTPNQSGSITEQIVLNMKVDHHTEKATFYVSDLGDKDLILGHTWLYHHNPEINWQTGDISFTRCPKNCNMTTVRQRRKRQRTNAKIRALQRKMPILSNDTKDEEEDVTVDDDERVFCTFFRQNHIREFWINATSTASQKLAEQAKANDQPKSFEDSVPSFYHSYKDVFSKESFDQLPEKKQWNHAIELKPGAEPFRSKIYPVRSHTRRCPETKLIPKMGKK